MSEHISQKPGSADLILQAVVSMLATQEPGDIRVDGVAQRAGVNKRMIYHHFGSRRGLLQAAMLALSEFAGRNIESVSVQAFLRQAVPVAAHAQAHIDPGRVNWGEHPPDLACAARILLAAVLRADPAIIAPLSPGDGVQLLQLCWPPSESVKPVYRLKSTSRSS